MNSVEINPEIAAALTWDSPSLLQSANPGAQAFFRAMTGRAPDDLDDASGALEMAAQAVTRLFQGQRDAAEATAHRIADLAEPDERLLGLMLLTWISDSIGDFVWSTAGELTAAVSDPRLRAHLHTKLMTNAVDKGEIGKASQFLDLALADATGALRSQLDLVATNHFDRALDGWPGDYRGEPLVDLPWITAAAERALDTAILDLASNQMRPSWGTHQRFGHTPTTRLVVAESQATWAGAMWLRDSLRQTLAALLLLDRDGTESDYTEALALLIEGGYGEVSNAVSYAESKFSRNTADELLTDRLRFDALSPRGKSSFAKAARSAWDLVSEATASTLLNRLVPSSGDDPMEIDIRGLWALLSLSAPQAWLDHITRLDSSIQEGILVAIQSSQVPVMSIEVAQTVADRLRRAEDLSLHFHLLIALHDRDPDLVPEPSGLFNRRTAPDVVVAAERTRAGSITPELLQVIETDLAEQVESDLRRSEQGTTSFGGPDRRQLLGAVSSLLEEPSSRSLRALLRSAMAESAHIEIRRGALAGLLELAAAGRLPDDALSTIEYAPTSVNPPEVFGNTTRDLIRALVLAIQAQARKAFSITDFVSLSRSHDARARGLVLSAVSASDLESDATIAPYVRGVVLGGLHDPDSEVVGAALRALSTDGVLDSVVGPSVVARMTDLYKTSRRRVRAEVAQASLKLQEVLEARETIDLILGWARADRSWQVRNAAASSWTREDG